MFWVAMLFRESLTCRRNISLPSSGSKSRKLKNPAEAGDKMSSSSAGFFGGLPFDRENGGNMFHRNVRISPNYMVLQPTRPYS
jgi:hypothetical protein